MSELMTTQFGELLALGEITRADLTRFVKSVASQPGALGRDPFPLHEHLEHGFYRREVHLPRGHVIVGAVHLKESYAIMLKGKIMVADENGVRTVEGPCTFTQPANKQKVGYVIEDTIWLDIHNCDAETTDEAYAMLFRDTYDELDRLDYLNLLDDLGLTEQQARSETEREDNMTTFTDEIMRVVEVRPSDIEGDGLFARINICKGAVIAPARVGDFRTPAGRFTNHSISPNAVARVCDDVIDFVAVNNIRVGDEITVDYRQALNAANELEQRG